MKALKAITALALVVALGACAEEVPVPTPSPDPLPESPGAVIDDERLELVLEDIRTALAEADAESNPEKFGNLIIGPAAELRQAEYDLSTITEEPVSALSTESQLSIVAATDTWPRTVFVATSIPEGANLPLLLVLTQEDPRATYQLWSWVRLLPGTELPQTVASSIGSAQLAEDSDELKVSPGSVIRRYANVLRNGEESEYLDQFGEDAFRELVWKDVEDLDEAVSQAGEATLAARSYEDEYPATSMQTYDGGAIVFGTIWIEITVEKTVPRGTLKVGDVLAYGGDDEVVTDEPLTAHYLTSVAFYVPPAGSDADVQLLGAEHVLADVTRDSDEEDSE